MAVSCHPTPIIKANKTYGVSPLEVHFDGNDSYAHKGTLTDWYWEFGDGDTSHTISPTHVFTAPSSDPFSYIVRLTVTDSLNTSTTEEILISLNNTPPEVMITSFEDGDKYPADKTTLLTLRADVNDGEHSDSR